MLLIVLDMNRPTKGYTLEKTRHVKIPRTRERSVACSIRRLTSQSGVETRIFARIPPLLLQYIFTTFFQSLPIRANVVRKSNNRLAFDDVCVSMFPYINCASRTFFFTCDDFLFVFVPLRVRVIKVFHALCCVCCCDAVCV